MTQYAEISGRLGRRGLRLGGRATTGDVPVVRRGVAGVGEGP